MSRRHLPLAMVAAAAAAAMAGWWLGSNRHPPPPVPDGLETSTTTAAPLIREGIRFVESHPGDAEARYHLALVYEANDDPSRAGICLEQAIALAPDAPPAWYHLALVHEHFGALDEAIAAMERVVELAPGYAPRTGTLASGGWTRTGSTMPSPRFSARSPPTRAMSRPRSDWPASRSIATTTPVRWRAWSPS